MTAGVSGGDLATVLEELSQGMGFFYKLDRGRLVVTPTRQFELELPPILSGLDAVAIQAECGKALDEVFTLLHEPGGGVA